MVEKKKLGWSLLAVVLAALSITTVFSRAKNLSISDIRLTLKNADFRWLFLSVLAMLGFIVFEGKALLSILRQVGYNRSHGQGFLYAAGDIYFSAITPSATGGQPASAFFMMQSGIPGPVVTAVLLLNLVMYTLGILTIGLFCMITAPKVFLHFHLVSRILIVAGYFALILLAIIFLLLLVRKEILELFCTKALWGLNRLHLVRKPEKKIHRLKQKIEEYQDCVKQMRGHKRAFVSAYLWNLAQRVSQISVSMFMFLATGGNFRQACSVWVTQSLVAIGSNCVPIPGGMGVADYLMLDGFRGLMSETASFQLELLSRTLSFYICVLVSGITVAVGYGFYRIRKRKEHGS